MKKILIALSILFILSFSMALSLPMEKRINETDYDEWSKTYGLSNGGTNDVIKTNGGYILVGESTTYKGGEENWDAWITKVDEGGNEIWDKMWRGKEYTRPLA